MAKLNSYFGLCPLIDHKSLLGIAKCEEDGYIVTLGKNIAVKYRLSDQKQIQSWRTKDKFSSPVIFDKEESRYVAVFNQVNIRLWTDDEHLDKIKKYKFTKPIHTLINCNNKAFIIFKNGSIVTLKNALEQRKDLKIRDVIETNSEEIIDVLNIHIENTLYICLIVKTNAAINCLWTSFSNNNILSDYHKIKLSRNNIELSGYTLCQMYNKYIYFLTLWSDGQLFSYSFSESTNLNLEDNHKEEFGSPYAKIESVSCKQGVAMAALSSDHIAIYGADCNQEGASVIIYNTQFKISQSKQTFKMFSNTNKMWCEDSMLFLCSGQNLAVVPFNINTEKLSQIVGNHKLDTNDLDVLQTFTTETWEIEDVNDYTKSIPAKIRATILNYLGQGLSEMTICDNIIPIYIGNSDTEAIENCIYYFKDISEECLVKILSFIINTQLSYDDSQIPNRNLLIEKILSLPFTSILLLPHIKASLDINTTLNLLKYICMLLSSDYCLPKLDYVQTENKLIEWGCVILDGNYQRLLLTRDSEVHNVLKEFNAIVHEHLLCLTNLKGVEPVINEFISGKSISSSKQHSNVKYCIEEVKLF